MDEAISRFFSDLIGRLTGPMNFRIVLQPAMAMLFATLDGVKDARAGRTPYLRSIFTDPAGGGRLLEEGAKRVLRVLLLGVVMDAIYQIRLFRTIYPLELLVVVLLLAFVPYVLLRGPINRLLRTWIHPDRLASR